LSLTLEEKVSLLSGKDFWGTVPIERLGIPSLVMTDGPHGVRTVPNGDRMVSPATSFPTAIGMASSWNKDVTEQVGAAIGEETHALGCDIILGPCVNIVRHPLFGRAFECYSEDPYLAGKLGAAYVKGVQSENAGTSLKHFAANNQEIERFRNSSEMDERTLREIYLVAFETIVKEADPWTVMCSYNRLNGVHASENYYLLTEILRDEWGYQGVVVSDWGANHSISESVKAGLDIEMPGPAKYYGDLLMEAVRMWQIDESVIDKAVTRILRMISKSGLMEAPRPAGSLNTSAHQALACELAEESITLLKNDGSVLPLSTNNIQSIAVIGPNATEIAVSGGGSAQLEPPYKISPLEALQEKVGSKIHLEYTQGCHHYGHPVIVKPDYLFLPSGNGHGLTGAFYNNLDYSGAAVFTRDDLRVDFWGFDFGSVEGISAKEFSARWTGKIQVPETGLYNLHLVHTGKAALYIDGKQLFTNDYQNVSEFATTKEYSELSLVGGQMYDIRIDFVKPAKEFGIIQLLVDRSPHSEDEEAIRQAVELARRCDVAVVFAGVADSHETEGTDRKHLNLPGRQNDLIKAVTAANPKTVVVLNAAAPYVMPWVDEVPAIVQSFFPGLEGGRAIARILFGEVNPSGHLSVTYPKRLEDTPAFTNYPGGKQVHYGEGIFVGYRWYDARAIEPLFPFGHGLSYTTFEYGPVTAPQSAVTGEPVKVSFTLKNTGAIAGKEVVQLYLGDKEASVARPPKELKGFAKVSLEPGESNTVEFVLNERDFAFYSVEAKAWVVEPGEFDILIGSSSRDIRSKATIILR
ncbi:MAG TPA: glycoside hydrolase family 3 C-terminal domain-containing protein, partial [Bacillota bacterium]|nr:glycoside hydrolase family 3 C-terminal domain-containing protein [Bacillota bacterium]